MDPFKTTVIAEYDSFKHHDEKDLHFDYTFRFDIHSPIYSHNIDK